MTLRIAARECTYSEIRGPTCAALVRVSRPRVCLRGLACVGVGAAVCDGAKCSRRVQRSHAAQTLSETD
eukprot:scaffold1324_cov117-Isochrysis_galbana.AAC.5